jgi:hypothetical protein
MFTTIDEFVTKVKSLENVADAYDVFEDECTEELRDEIYDLADPDDYEPFRAAMHSLGFETY